MTSQILPWWMPLSVFVWGVQMVVFHGVGYAFEYCDRTRALRRFKVREIDRKSYAQLMGRVLANQVFILLPCMVAMQLFGLAFSGQATCPYGASSPGSPSWASPRRRAVRHASPSAPQSPIRAQAQALGPPLDRRQQGYQRVLHERRRLLPRDRAALPPAARP